MTRLKMPVPNYTASFLYHKGKRILDDMDSNIPTLYYEKKIYPLRYIRPFVTFDIINKERDKVLEKEPRIRVIREDSELKKLGLILCSLKIQKHESWFDRQMTRLALYYVGQEEFGAKKVKILHSGTDYHKIEFDEANLRIRLVGRKASPTGVGPWIQVK